jgi:hypothetical protein
MQGLPILIRLAQRRTDERRLALAAAERDRVAAEEALALHDAAVAAETAGAAGDSAAMAQWSQWIRAAGRRRHRLQAASLSLAAAEERIRAALREDFAEIKRLEIAQGTRQQAAARAAAQKAEKAAEDREMLRAAAVS